VRRPDVERLLAEHTFAKDQVSVREAGHGEARV
jgi:hypothetical protein